MNPRRIAECVASIEALPVDQAWLSGYSERDLPINQVVERTNYDRYMIISDDGIVPQSALRAVLSAHDAHPEDVATGYSNLGENDARVNLVSEPLREPLSKEAYSLMTAGYVATRPPVFRSWFAGYALTVMPRRTWLECPHPGRENANDYYHCLDLHGRGHRIWAAREGRVTHAKRDWSEPDKTPGRELLVGLIPAEVRWRFI